ncbi:MAG: type II toxin-antitoxin system RelE/ParE family toxin [Chloroflexi bacterium]|nr:type II toxin-antitoxin system RelE/ParE family toxin [Chloroflexota bacterium]
MELRFDDSELEALYMDVQAKAKFPIGVVKSYRRRIWQVRAAKDGRDLRAIRGLRFEKYQRMEGHYSIRLNDQYRLIVTFDESSPRKTIVIVAVLDYH